MARRARIPLEAVKERTLYVAAESFLENSCKHENSPTLLTSDFDVTRHGKVGFFMQQYAAGTSSFLPRGLYYSSSGNWYTWK